MGDYPKFGSIPRLHREISITEKIDGSNGCIFIDGPVTDENNCYYGLMPRHDLCKVDHLVAAGSRSRWLTLDSDNFGFAVWVKSNWKTLVSDLGPGLHYGEWWGSGIQRGYGLPKGEKRFSLFNVSRWTTEQEPDKFSLPHVKPVDFVTPGLGVVPVLTWKGDGAVLGEHVRMALGALRLNGSFASDGFMRPEGIVIYHHAANMLFKVTLENDEVPKKIAAARSKGVK
jgi:hypothetical protein